MDGRGPSIWDHFAAQPGNVEDGSDGTIACDHFHRWPQDIELMKRLGVDAYRFSVAWPRIFPSGRGPPNEAGLAFYERLVDGLLEAGIRPFLTLYHWDLPQALQEAGGWPARDTSQAFVDYALAVARRLKDRVGYWVTHNEPWCISVLGHLEGVHAPGLQDVDACLRTAHHVLLSHGWAVQALRDELPAEAQAGIVLNLVPAYPASDGAADRQAARRFDARFNRWFLEPLYLGRYPEDGVDDLRAQGDLPDGPLPFVEAGDMEAISTTTDFLGLNYYTRAVLRAEEETTPRSIPAPDPAQFTDMGWEVFPEGMEAVLRDVHESYGPPAIYITENGCAHAAEPDDKGRIQDEARTRFIETHLAAVHRALEGGVPVRGHFVWSLLDNFEWAHGYTKRFGIAWVDYETQRRTLKDSGLRYAEIIGARGWESES